jgi:hypothetical protein
MHSINSAPENHIQLLSCNKHHTKNPTEPPERKNDKKLNKRKEEEKKELKCGLPTS